MGFPVMTYIIVEKAFNVRTGDQPEKSLMDCKKYNSQQNFIYSK